MFRRLVSLFSAFFLLSFSSYSQEKTAEKDTMVNKSDIHIKADTSRSTFLVVIDFAYQKPGGDMAKRFKSNGSLGGGGYYKTKSNWMLGGEAHFIFGGKPKDQHILDSLKTGKSSKGDIIDNNGRFADIRMYERGYDITGRIGKIFPFGTLNRNSGIYVMGGAGFLQHKIRIENTGNHVPQLSKEYRVGYDHLANGLLLSETFGFFYMGDSKGLNFNIALEFAQGMTQGRRYDFSLNKLDNAKRNDLFFGVRLGWMLPLKEKEPEEFYTF